MSATDETHTPATLGAAHAAMAAILAAGSVGDDATDAIVTAMGEIENLALGMTARNHGDILGKLQIFDYRMEDPAGLDERYHLSRFRQLMQEIESLWPATESN